MRSDAHRQGLKLDPACVLPPGVDVALSFLEAPFPWLGRAFFLSSNAENSPCPEAPQKHGRFHYPKPTEPLLFTVVLTPSKCKHFQGATQFSVTQMKQKILPGRSPSCLHNHVLSFFSLFYWRVTQYEACPLGNLKTLDTAVLWSVWKGVLEMPGNRGPGAGSEFQSNAHPSKGINTLHFLQALLCPSHFPPWHCASCPLTTSTFLSSSFLSGWSLSLTSTTSSHKKLNITS